jgi:hypothetical protein
MIENLPNHTREKSEVFPVRLPLSLLAELSRLAIADHRSIANMMRVLISEALEARKKREEAQ